VLKKGEPTGDESGATNKSGPRRAASEIATGAFSQEQTFKGVLDFGAGVVSLCFCSVAWWQQQLLCLKGAGWPARFSTGRR
jgi:hypothetical protein